MKNRIEKCEVQPELPLMAKTEETSGLHVRIGCEIRYDAPPSRDRGKRSRLWGILFGIVFTLVTLWCAGIAADRLKPEFRQTFIDYVIKAIEAQ